MDDYRGLRVEVSPERRPETVVCWMLDTSHPELPRWTCGSSMKCTGLVVVFGTGEVSEGMIEGLESSVD